MQQIAEWIRSKNPELDREPGPQDDLIEARLIDSLDFLEFIYLLESVSGQVIDLQHVSIDDFRTLERIEQRFLTQRTEEAAR
ncbi:acyl carrier protein [Peterkaempfera bronchialis]|uniref:Acyl carrier protein n=1 Tax=Peterkaempfera bronchialis TaxID=2126346 RepID=A0A345SRZ2_9ACTN|nr:acyl carrier protein [Peterkaempfera bronchialis]AXI76497.1 acyl carrier protein [Peterkaempfera bronchialis]